MGGRLTQFWEKWEENGASDWVVSVLREGYALEFESDPPLSNVCLIDSCPSNPAKRELLRQEFDTMIQKGALEPVRVSDSPGFYSRIFIVSKSGGARLIIDLSILNKY